MTSLRSYFQEEQDKRVSLISVITGLGAAFGGILLGFLICRIFLLPFNVNGRAMEPGLKHGTRIIILKHITPKKGDIVLMRSPFVADRVLLRRIIAGEGDTVEIRNRVVLLNDKEFHFPWKTLRKDGRAFPMGFDRRDNMPSVKLKRHEYFMMGDNIDLSHDSRSFGPVTDEAVIGRLVYAF